MKRVIPLVTLLALAGCVSRTAQSPPPIPERHSLPLMEERIALPSEGAIFTAKAKNIYQDNRACRIGDLVLIKIVETSSGSKTANTSTSRASTISGGITSLFGFEDRLLSGSGLPSSSNLNGGLTNSFNAQGQTDRDSTVTATLSARVVEIAMDGNLKIQGYREIRVNNETQHIILSGIVRPADISKDNSILSSNIAEARIEYSGTGTLGDKQQPGWLANVLDVISPF